MRAESARVSESAEKPANWQHANQCNQTDDADWNIAFRDRQRIGFACLTCARCSHRASQTADKRLCQLQQSPNRRNADRAGANISDFAAPRAARKCSQWSCEIVGKRRVVWYSPAPTDQRTDKHGYSHREADKVPNPEQ